MKTTSMQRSKTQLAVSYAPGSLFTFEGGRGCFISIPMMTQRSNIDSSPAVRQQATEILTEFVQSWYERGMNCRPSGSPQIHPEQVLCPSLFEMGTPSFRLEKFLIIEPSLIGYHPYPLNFRCRKCGLLHLYRDADALATHGPQQEARTDCREGTHHEWVQLDVLFHHWSGTIEPLHPAFSCHCGGKEFRLLKSETGQFSAWKWECTSCNTLSNLLRRDERTREIFRDNPGAAHPAFEMDMLPVSYRASSLCYVQAEKFIPATDPQVLSLLQPLQESELARAMMGLYHYETAPYKEDEIRTILIAVNEGEAFEAYQEMKALAATKRQAGRAQMAEQFETMAARMIEDWIARGKLPRKDDVDPSLLSQAMARRSLARRYDPFRLALEHQMIRDRHMTDNQNKGINLLSPTLEICPQSARGTEGMLAYKTALQKAYDTLGVEEAHLLRGFEVVQLSFGYSRACYGPVGEHRNMAMPVRLNLFDYVEPNKRPIYALEQHNEGLYIRLNQERILEWLATNHIDCGPPLPPGQRFGSRYLERYADFGFFLEEYRKPDGASRDLCNYTYLLLHTMAHQFAHAISELSGLELGSLGECIFPADLAFVVYRSALTPDLGNISSMWRNHGPNVFRKVYDPRLLLCGSGSLCDHRGGACPGCIMSPETSCLAWNNLLSRSALIGGNKPPWDDSQFQRMEGFLR